MPSDAVLVVGDDLLVPRIWAYSSVTVAAIGLFGFMTYGNLTGSPGYREVRVEQGNIVGAVITTGRVQPNKRIDAKAPLAGRTEKVLVNIGDKVVKGQTLLWMSSSERAAVLDTVRLNRPKEMAHWQETLPATALLAPVSGIVIQRNTEPGQTFTEGDAIIVLADEIIVEAPVDEIEVGQLKVGQKASTTLDSYPDVLLPGSIESIGFEARKTDPLQTQPTPVPKKVLPGEKAKETKEALQKDEDKIRMYLAKMAFDHIPDEVRVGMTANVKFETSSKAATLLIPVAALRADRDELYVLVPGGFGKAPDRRMVKIGLSDGDKLEVTEGLKSGDVILVDNRGLARPKEAKGAFGADAPPEN